MKEIGVKGFDGEVLEITGRSTVLRLRDGRRVHIPNTDVVGETIVVYTTDQLRRTAVEIEIAARHPLEAVERVLLEALDGLEAVAAAPAPQVRARRFGDDSVALSVRFWHHSGLDASSQALDQALRAMSAALGRAGMSLASGSLLVELHQANADVFYVLWGCEAPHR